MIWDIIRDFIVHYITGGYDSEGAIYRVGVGNDGSTSDQIEFFVGQTWSGTEFTNYNMNLSDYLANTLTIIIMFIGVVLLCLLVRWVFKTVINAFAFRR